MTKRVIVAGLLGGVALMAWTFVFNGILGFTARLYMRQIPNERQVYEVLNENVTEPGRYLCNPQVTDEVRFPDDQPVFSVIYGGVGHEAAGRLALLQIPIFLAAPLLAAWLLAHASRRVLASYFRKVLFVMAIGVLLGVSGPLSEFGIGGYPFGDAVLLALHQIALWTVVGLVIAWRMRPQPAA